MDSEETMVVSIFVEPVEEVVWNVIWISGIMWEVPDKIVGVTGGVVLMGW
jgi:hypothetical protein